jgi:hypothetical protein
MMHVTLVLAEEIFLQFCCLGKSFSAKVKDDQQQLRECCGEQENLQPSVLP